MHETISVKAPAPEKKYGIIAYRNSCWREDIVEFKLYDGYHVALMFPDVALESKEDLAQFISDSAAAWVKRIRNA